MERPINISSSSDKKLSHDKRIIELRNRAKYWWELGCDIVLMKEKRPVHDWKRWMNERQSEDDFNSLPWDKADGFAIILGQKAKNGLYICAIDLDIRENNSTAVELGRKILNAIYATYTERTPSGGLHSIYFSKEKPRTIQAYSDVCALELLGEGHLLTMYPSLGYEIERKYSIFIVDDINKLFLDTLTLFGIEVKEKEEEEAESREEHWFNRPELEILPYRDEHPSCIRKMLEGTTEGNRNEYAIRLSSYFLNFRKLDEERAWKYIKEWNEKNRPPLDRKELKRTFESAKKGGYRYGCSDPILSSLCDESSCPLHRKQVKEGEEKRYDPEIEEKIEREVERIMKADNQIEAIKPHLDRVIVGEDEIKIPIFVLLPSGKIKDPEYKQIIAIKGAEGTGKSLTKETLIEGYRAKKVARFSEHALDYSDLSSYEILDLAELGYVDQEKQGVSTIKFVSADDKGYDIEVTVRNPETGRFTTANYRIPAMTVITSTTRILINRQFERRAWVFTTDDSEEQTERVKKWWALNELEKSRKKLGMIKITSYEFSLEVLRRFNRRFEPVDVAIPFPGTIVSELKSGALRMRSDLRKVFRFIEFYAMFNRKRLIKGPNGTYIVTPDVAIEALRFIAKPLARMHARLERRQIEVLQALKKLNEVRDVHVGSSGSTLIERRYDEAGAEITKDVREKIARILGKSERDVRDILNSLVASGYLSSDERKPKTFKLLYSVDEIMSKLSGGLEAIGTSNNLRELMAKEALEKFGLRLEIRPPGVSDVHVVHKTIKQGDVERGKENASSDAHVFHNNADNRTTDTPEYLVSKIQGSKEKAQNDLKTSKDWTFQFLPISSNDQEKMSYKRGARGDFE
ncbi:primase C-terminal domain-containing protein [Candidatus Methanodesulfokora washburnensis]|nr:primase C-terminal domain-containing protein [Candidatus Methanodesulfokores washburnensis]